MKYDTLKALVNAKVYENTEQRITGGDMNDVLQSAIASLGAHYQMGGLVSPTDQITVRDEPVVFLATTPGTYTYFGGLVVADGEVALLVWSGTAWSKQTPDISTRTEVNQLGQEVSADISQLEAEINGVAIIEKGYSWSNGYVGYTDGIYKVVTSSLSRFCQPVKFKEGEKLTYKTGSDYTYAVVQVNDDTPIASGDTISYLQTLISAPVANQQYEYTFPSDMWVVISIYSLDYTLNVYKYDSNSISKQISDLTTSINNVSVDVPIFRQGSIRSGVPYYSDNLVVESSTAIHTQALLYNEIEKIVFDSDNNEVWGFYYAADYSAISYAQLPSSGVLPEVTNCEYVVFGVNAKGDPITPEGFDIFTQFVINRKNDSDTPVFDYEKVYGKKTCNQTYSGNRIAIFDDASQYCKREQFGVLPFESKRHQSFAVYGQYALFMFYESMTGVLYRLTDNKKICDITFQTDSTYGDSHNNACGFGVEKYDADDDFPVFYLSQFNVGAGAYLAYRLIENDGVYTAQLIQIITASASLKIDLDFGLGYGDWVIDKDAPNLYHLGYANSELSGTIKLTKFALPGITEGVDFASSTGDTIKVVTLDTADILDKYNIGEVGLQDNCYYNGHIIISGWVFWGFVNLSTKTTQLVRATFGDGFDECEGVDVYMGMMLATYWNEQGVFSITFQ